MTTAITLDNVINFIEAQEESLASNEALMKEFGAANLEKLHQVINVLLSSKRLQLLTDNSNGLYYKAQNEDTAAKLEKLSQEQLAVYTEIEKSKDKGIWNRDIKMNSNLTQHVLGKCLKVLEMLCLIKTVRSVSSKTKKLYMLFNETPSEEVTGGPWYSADTQEFDHEFVKALGDYIISLVNKSGMLDLETISDKVKVSGISKVQLKDKEIELVLGTLVYDKRLEDVQSSVLLSTGYAAAKKVYKISKPISETAHLTDVPCGVCPVVHQCCEGGVISPTTCEYFTQWLDNAASMSNEMDITAMAGKLDW